MAMKGTIGFRADVKKMFFDRAAVMKAIRADERRYFAMAGASIMKTARRSIRKRKAVSKPGTPPTNRTGELKKNIFFAFDPATRSVVTGPARFAKGSGKPPGLLEHGGRTRAERRMVLKGGTGEHPRRTVIEKGTVLDYKPRPYMEPALVAIVPTLPLLRAKATRSF
jgi:hypothetical protein